MSRYDFTRRHTWEVRVGNTTIGGDNPVRLQSMTNTSTLDTEGSAAQIGRIAAAGADLVRLTAQGVRESTNLSLIRDSVRQAGVTIPLVADIHFNPKAAFEAAARVEKVRINPGNFVDPGRTFRKIEYTDAEYAAELGKIDTVFGQFLDICVTNDTAVRLGVNHGSLSDRIMSRYGDTPEGMVESVMEFLRVAMRRDFRRIVISIKASNVVVMVTTVRLLTEAMNREGMYFPLHLGVTEAGDAEDGRIKSAVGIGTLLSEGLGDTIRVSLSEQPECELPVSRILADYYAGVSLAPSLSDDGEPDAISDSAKPFVVGDDTDAVYDTDRRPDTFNVQYINAEALPDHIDPDTPIVLTSSHRNFAGSIRRAVNKLRQRGVTNPIAGCAEPEASTVEEAIVLGAAMLGPLVMNGVISGVQVRNALLSPAQEASLAYGILQAARRRITRTEYIACPGCGRTLFDLQQTLKRVKDATSTLKGLKIGVMGCIVNGPGEMADADYGYVGAGVGRVSLYKGKVCVKRNIPQEEAIDELVNYLKSEGFEL